MTASKEAAKPLADPRERIIVALDVDNEPRALELVEVLRGRVGAFKIGLELFVSLGPRFVRLLADRGEKVFLDLKFHDIPNTVSRAVSTAAGLGVWMMNVHAEGGREMMEAAAAAVSAAGEKANQPRPLLIGVTVLTSRDNNSLDETGHLGRTEERVVSLARLANACGLDGVVASPREVGAIRNAVPRPDFLTVTPGIRRNDGTCDDQKRVTTFGQALANGSSYVVIGRPVTGSPDPAATVEEFLSEIAI